MGLTSASLRLSHPLAAGALPKFESVLDTTFSLYMVVGEQVPTTIYNEKSLANARLSNFGVEDGIRTHDLRNHNPSL